MKKPAVVFLVLWMVFGASALCLASSVAGAIGFGPELEWNRKEKGLRAQSLPINLRLGWESNLGRSQRLKLSAQGLWDLHRRDGFIKPDQIWLKGYIGDIDYVLGKQVLNWGTADGFSPTNYFSRSNIGALLAGDLVGEPLWAAQASYYAPRWSGTLVFLPTFSPQILDWTTQKMMLDANSEAYRIIGGVKDTVVPNAFGRDSEYALRFETQVAGFDLQASYFRGFESLPGLEMETKLHPRFGIPTKVEVKGEYRRQHFLGLAATGTLGPCGLWGDLRYGGPEPFQKSSDPLLRKYPLSVNEKYLYAVVGGNITLPIGQGLLTQVQYIYKGQGSLFSPYAKPNQLLDGAHYLYAHFGYRIGLAFSTDLILVHSFTEKGGLIRASAFYSWPSAVTLELCVLNTYGEGEIGVLNPQGRLGLIYRF